MANVAFLGPVGTRGLGASTPPGFNQYDVFVLSAGADGIIMTHSWWTEWWLVVTTWSPWFQADSNLLPPRDRRPEPGNRLWPFFASADRRPKQDISGQQVIFFAVYAPWMTSAANTACRPNERIPILDLPAHYTYGVLIVRLGKEF